MPNFDGLYELRIFYTTTPVGFTIMQHRMTLDIKVNDSPPPGTVFPDIDYTARNGTVSSFDGWVDALVVLLQAIYPAATDISFAEMWFIPEGTTSGTFISSYPIGVNGTSANPSIPARQVTLTFRSIGGGTARCQLMESDSNIDTVEFPPYSYVDYFNIAEYITAPTSPVLARDNTFVFSNIKWNNGQNERLFRKRYR